MIWSPCSDETGLSVRRGDAGESGWRLAGGSAGNWIKCVEPGLHCSPDRDRRSRSFDLFRDLTRPATNASRVETGFTGCDMMDRKLDPTSQGASVFAKATPDRTPGRLSVRRGDTGESGWRLVGGSAGNWIKCVEPGLHWSPDRDRRSRTFDLFRDLTRHAAKLSGF